MENSNKKPSKKNPDLARLLGGNISEVEKTITGSDIPLNPKPETPARETSRDDESRNLSSSNDRDEPSSRKTPESAQEEKEEESAELTIISEDDLDLPKAFTKLFKKNPAFDKFRKTSALVYLPVLEEYKKVAGAMNVDTVVLMNNVLVEWFNKNIDTCEKVVSRKSKVRGF